MKLTYDMLYQERTTRVYGLDAQWQEQIMLWDDGDWNNDPRISLNSKKGYKLYIEDNTRQFIYCNGNRQSAYSDITLKAGVENWIGYFIPHNYNVFDAFGTYIEHIQSIRGETWTVNRNAVIYDPEMRNDPFIYPYHPGFPSGPTLRYGKMYKVRTNLQNDLVFNWTLPPGYPPPADDWTTPDITGFNFNDGPDYESFFITAISDVNGSLIEDVLEVGVFAGEDCVGASVFLGDYPLEILAYTNESHQGKEISFQVIQDGGPVVRGGRELLALPEIRDSETGEYSTGSLRALQSQHTIVRLTIRDNTETVVSPQIVMGQNFPNPMVLGMSSSGSDQTRSESVIATNIPIYLSKDMNVDISVFNIKGQRARTITSGNLTAGKHTFSWNGTNEQNQPVAAGVYFYRLESDIETINKKMLIIR